MLDRSAFSAIFSREFFVDRNYCSCDGGDGSSPGDAGGGESVTDAVNAIDFAALGFFAADNNDKE